MPHTHRIDPAVVELLLHRHVGGDAFAVYGLTRMYEILMEPAAPTVRTFREFKDALDWLGLPSSFVE